ncbi:MAG: hypothetical protein ACLP9K_10050 [Nitrososphaerales archaeon]
MRRKINLRLVLGGKRFDFVLVPYPEGADTYTAMPKDCHTDEQMNTIEDAFEADPDDTKARFNHCMLNDWCVVCGPDLHRQGNLHFRDGQLLNLCEGHAQAGDVSVAITEVRAEPEPLTNIEKGKALHSQIIQLIEVEGMSYRRVGEELNISSSTVSKHNAKHKEGNCECVRSRSLALAS